MCRDPGGDFVEEIADSVSVFGRDLDDRIKSQPVVGLPSTKTSPPLGKSKAFTIFKAVVFPEPLRPKSTRVSPASTSKLRLERMSF